MTTVSPDESETSDYLWGYFEAGEDFAEQYAGEGIKKLAGGDIPLIKAGSLAILAFGKDIRIPNPFNGEVEFSHVEFLAKPISALRFLIL